MTANALRLAALVVLCGCTTTQAPDVETWIIRPEFSTEPVEHDADAVVLELARVDVAPHVNGVTIIRANRQVDHLLYHRWAAPVGETVSSWIRERLQRSPRVAAVLGRRDGIETDGRLVIEVVRFEFVDDGAGGSQAMVELWGTLAWANGSAVLRGLTGQQSLGTSTGAELPAAMSSALAQAVDQLTHRVERALSRADR